MGKREEEVEGDDKKGRGYTPEVSGGKGGTPVKERKRKSGGCNKNHKVE